MPRRTERARPEPRAPRTLNLVGAGRVGRALGRLWHRAGVFRVGSVLCRRAERAAAAVAFVGAGEPVDAVEALGPADVHLIAVPDDAIERAAEALAAAGVLRPGDCVFHPSGAHPSAVLGAAARAGAHVASVHPVKSFADPAAAAESFAGTGCGVEGDAEALAVLRPAFEALGARLFDVDPDRKTLYHAANVFGCNYVTALLDLALRCYEAAGVARGTAAEILAPIARETVANALALGPAAALTGPVARGDAGTVARHAAALRDWDADAWAVYRALGWIAADLSERKGDAAPAALAAIRTLLATE